MNGDQCQEIGCSGTIEDGYCNVCGTPASAPSAIGSQSVAQSRASNLSTKLTSTPIGSARAGLSRPTRRLVTATSRVQHLGAGITNVPAAPVADPQTSVLTNPSVPEEKRFCSSCGAAVGRSRDGVASD